MSRWPYCRGGIYREFSVIFFPVHSFQSYYIIIGIETGSGHPVTFSLGHPGLTQFTNYPGLTRIGSHEKRSCSFDDLETYKRYRLALS